MQSLRPTVDWLLGERSDSPEVAAERWTHADSLLTTGSTSASSCGRQPPTRDHVPSRVPLDAPYPDDLPAIRAPTEAIRYLARGHARGKSLSPCELPA